MPNVTIVGTAQPWAFTGGINASLPYGLNDGTAPVIAAKELKANQQIWFKYVSGTVQASNARPFYDANGDTTTIANGNLLSTGNYAPSLYMPSDWSKPVYLIQVVGCWADKNGVVLGTPFAIGDGPFVITVPSIAGLYQLQLGANDDHYADNVGSWVMNVIAAEIQSQRNISEGFARNQYDGFWKAGSSGGNTTGSGQIFPTLS